MKVLRLFVFVAFVLSVFVSPSFSASSIVAKVGAVVITEAELSREFQKILPQEGSYHGTVSNERLLEIREKALEALVERAHKAQFALDSGVQIDRLDIANIFMKTEGQYPDRESFNKALSAEGADQFRGSIERSLLAEKGDALISASIEKPSDEDVKGYYEQHKDYYRLGKQFTASHIFIRVDPASTTEARQELLAKAESLASKGKNGESFYNLAYFNSDDRTKFVGGALGTFGEKTTEPEFDAALQSMAPGDISDVVRTIYGYHVIHLEDVQPERQRTFEEVKNELRNAVIEQRRSAAYKSWFAEQEAKYPVERFDK